MIFSIMEEKSAKAKTNNIFLTSLTNRADANFFASAPKVELNDTQQENPIYSGRINDYDSSILENNAYQAISDEIFKIEHKIGMLEESLSKLNNEIDTLEAFGYGIQVSNLKDRRKKIEQELAELNKKYSELGIGAKISGQIAAAVKFSSRGNINLFSRIKNFLTRNILAKFSKKFDYTQAMTEALNNLSNINLSVDELIKMQVPYGENVTRYEKLTAYLNKANVIHSQIYKNVNSMTKKNP